MMAAAEKAKLQKSAPTAYKVYKQGNQLVIRLRGFRFPVGQAVLSPENYALLSKVQKAIQTFDQPTVTIEGHTDSTGSTQMNKELSQKRAESVKRYLVANNTLPENPAILTEHGLLNPALCGQAVNRIQSELLRKTESDLPDMVLIARWRRIQHRKAEPSTDASMC